LQRQVADRESKGTVMRIRTAHFPQVKTLDDVNLRNQPSNHGQLDIPTSKRRLVWAFFAALVPHSDNPLGSQDR
jgi:hypothetical protein